MSVEKKWKPSRLDVIFAILFAAVLALSVWKCRYGYISDDGFYLTVPHRLSKGDVLFADEWHVSQMAGLLMVPMVWLYRAIVGSTVGILLAGRYIYVAVHALVSGFCYLRVRKYGAAGAAAALSWFLFVPYSIMALSYNTMGMELVLLACLLLATLEKKWCWALSGVCLAGAVLCCPYFAAAWFFYAAAVGLRALRLRRGPARGGADHGILAPSRLLWLTAGTAAVAALFLLYVLTTCGIRGVLDNLPYILSDPEHEGVSLPDKLLFGLNRIANCHPGFPVILAGCVFPFIVMLADRDVKKHRGAYLIAACALTAASYALFWSDAATYYNAIMFPMIFVGVISFLLCEERPWGLFVTLFLGGIVYAVAVTLGSNNYFYAISMASAVFNMGSILFMGQLLREIRADRGGGRPVPWLSRAALCAAVFTVSALLVSQLRVRATHCFMEEDPPFHLTAALEWGPGKGIRTNERAAQVYNTLGHELEQLNDELPPGKILILNARSWTYLVMDNMEYATFSAWMGYETQSALDRMECYYALNPAKIPNYIFLSKNALFDDVGAIVSAARDHGYTVTDSENSYLMRRD